MDRKAAESFLWTHARLLERRIFAFHFGGAPAEDVERAVLAYQDADGGFGGALEPDCRTPHPQPEAMRWALAVLEACGRLDASRAGRCADWLASVSLPGGGLPFCLATVEGYPKAPWWRPSEPPEASLNPTGRLVGLLRRHVPDHAWVQEADAWCWTQLEQALAEDQYFVRSAVELLLTAPDPARAEPLLEKLGAALGAGRVVPLDPEAPPPHPDTHTPLDFAPTPGHPLRRFFADHVIDGFLERLLTTQQQDGGWPIDWPAPGASAVLEWRGVRTLDALLRLHAYGRL